MNMIWILFVVTINEMKTFNSGLTQEIQTMFGEFETKQNIETISAHVEEKQ